MKSVIVFLKNVWNAQRNAESAETLFDYQCFYAAARDAEEATRRANELLRVENAALRSQISQRDASGRFAKKNAS